MSSKFLGKKRFRKARKNSSEGFGFFKRVNNGVWFCFVGGVEWSGVGKLYSFFFGVMKCWLKPTILVKVGSYPWRKMCDLGSEGITFKSFPEKNGTTKKFHDTGCFIGILIMLCSNPRTIGQHYPLHTLNNQFFFKTEYGILILSFLASRSSRVSLLPAKFGKAVNQPPHPSEIDSQFDYGAYVAKWLVIQPPTSCDFVRFPKITTCRVPSQSYPSAGFFHHANKNGHGSFLWCTKGYTPYVQRSLANKMILGCMLVRGGHRQTVDSPNCR